jgi:hypothetical protein
MIDPNEAPDGFVAEPFLDCGYCAFMRDPRCPDQPCLAWERADKTEVQFRKIEKRQGGE